MDRYVVVQVGFQRPLPVITYGSGSPTQSPSGGVPPPR